MYGTQYGSLHGCLPPSTDANGSAAICTGVSQDDHATLCRGCTGRVVHRQSGQGLTAPRRGTPLLLRIHNMQHLRWAVSPAILVGSVAVRSTRKDRTMKFGLMYEIQVPEPHYDGIEHE